MKGIDSLDLAPFTSLLDLSQRGITTKAIREARTIYVPDVSVEPDYVEVNPHAVTELTVPIIFEGKVLGVLDVESPCRGAFNDQHRRLLEILSLHVSTAIVRLRQESELRKPLR